MVISRAVLISGTVGVGKTTVGQEIAALLRDADEPNAFVDVDAIADQWPAPDDDPFNLGLAVANLACMIGNLERARVRSLVLAGIAESAHDIDRFRAALGQCPLTLIRLVAPSATVEARLVARHEPWDAEGLRWHRERAPVLAASLDASVLEAFGVNTDGDPRDAAAAVLSRLGWLAAP
jgi:adenylylsulfate kinase